MLPLVSSVSASRVLRCPDLVMVALALPVSCLRASGSMASQPATKALCAATIPGELRQTASLSRSTSSIGSKVENLSSWSLFIVSCFFRSVMDMMDF